VELEHVFRWYMAKFLDSGTLDDADVSCFSPPVWALVLCSISSLLMTLNASSGIFIYSLVCQQFRWLAYFCSKMTFCFI
jgi:hypothetical protein